MIYLPTQVQLTITKIIKIVATMHMTDFKAYSAPQTLYLDLGALLLREGSGGEGGREGEEKGRERKGP